MTPWTDRGDSKLSNVKLRQTAIDITADDLAPRLNASNVADLVLISMVNTFCCRILCTIGRIVQIGAHNFHFK